MVLTKVDLIGLKLGDVVVIYENDSPLFTSLVTQSPADHHRRSFQLGMRWWFQLCQFDEDGGYRSGNRKRFLVKG